MSERCAVDVSVHGVGPEKLRMIECVKRLKANLQRSRFAEACKFVERHVVVVHPRPVEGPPRRIALRAQRIRAEERSVEVRLAVARVPIDLKVAGSHIRQVNTDAIDPVVSNAYQRIISEAGERHRQSRREARDARQSPSLSYPATRVEQFFQRKLVIV